ncbi:MAG: thioesterase family protein [Mogibacterium sp.]|nr:thioesterase family protein [Mogibacterium sp.]
MAELKVGMKFTREVEVVHELTADAVHSGGLPVFATPMMIGLMENASWSLAEECMEEGYSTVGTLVNVKHISATPVGATVRAETELTEIDGRRLVFKVAAYDDKGLIGEGTHERFIINTDKFMNKTNAK